MKKSLKINRKDLSPHVVKVIKILRKAYPDAKCALYFSNPLEILVATILSAQCTDVRVNMVTPGLFRKYKSCADYAKAKPEDLQKDIKSTGFYRNKAKSIQGACRMILEKFGGEVPRTMKEILELPGVARKTANVVLHNAYGVVEGIVVDTHVRRLSRRLGFTVLNVPEKIEQDLLKIVPRKDWGDLSYLLIDHGRAVCKAQKPDCRACPVSQVCPSAFSFDAKGRWIGVK
ncbi:endonuclease III [Candidatus Peregrinibacteria bacterium]|nr:endonuclease III [Candidatus Peregrinibacteria bacterium]